MTMKRLMIMAAMMSVLACGDDASSDDDSTAEEKPSKDAGKADASKSDAGGGNECLLLNYASFGKAFEEKYCASCHGADVEGKDRNAAPDDAVFDTLAQIKAEKADLKDRVVVKKTMPLPLKDFPVPTDAERAQFGKFLDCGPN